MNLKTHQKNAKKQTNKQISPNKQKQTLMVRGLLKYEKQRTVSEQEVKTTKHFHFLKTGLTHELTCRTLWDLHVPCQHLWCLTTMSGASSLKAQKWQSPKFPACNSWPVPIYPTHTSLRVITSRDCAYLDDECDWMSSGRGQD